MLKLTDRTIKATPIPAKGRKLIFDSHTDAPAGFGIRAASSGKITFVLRYNADGRDRLLTIGEYGTWTLAAARTRARALRQQVDGGTDILRARRDRRGEATVADVVDRYCRAHVDKLKSAPSVRGAFYRHVLPAIGRMKVSDVRRRDVIAIIEGLAVTHPRQAALTLQYIKQLFAWCEDKEIIASNPVYTLKAGRISQAMKARPRVRVLTNAEIVRLWAGVPDGMSHVMWQALRFILATGQRPGEVLKAEVAEVHGKTWTIPASHRGKTHTEQRVPLTDTALAILHDAGGARFLFEYRGEPMTSAALSRAVSRCKADLSDPATDAWRPHDLRRTMRTGLAEAKARPDIAELAVGHTKKGIVAVYDQARYGEEIRAAMEAWERRLMWILAGQPDDGGTVVNIREARA